ncbi:uncharacterized conserved protein [Moesziomyces antarcticus T-34]|uniref:rRNA biogenesis protein RRP36 n=1 Tax=Pseudozyma antarctica (strain T-34) TaxID=1151754 RepID=M9LNI9_PSEA3|nr:uncharacterized conserved protein [Moesziomyces antarcticus T-34]
MAKKAAASGGASHRKPKTAPVFEQDSDRDDGGSLNLDSASELDSDVDASDSSDAADGNDDVESQNDEEEEQQPKYAQFMDDSDLEAASDDDDDDDDDDHGDSDGSDEEGSNDGQAQYSSDEAGSDLGEAALKQQMKQIPFSALMKARRQMDASDSDELSEPDIADLEEDEFAEDRRRLARQTAGKQPARSGKSSSSAADADEALEQKRREVRERLRQLNGNAAGPSSEGDNAWAEARRQREQRRKENERKELAKRANKNAPTEISSKRPVSRRRTVVDTPTAHIRDPRFESLSGSVNKDLFSKSYSFLPDMFKDELSTLKKTLAKLKKQEATQAGPKAKSEHAQAIRDERAKVEAALRRAEGLAGERERRQRESTVKARIKTQNKERVDKGLQPFYPKKSEIKQMLLKDKYDRLAGTGDTEGRRASGQEKKQLKKALERRRRKNAQKEKRDMPVGIGFGPSGSGANAAIPKRKRHAGAPDATNKRSRF